MAYRYPWVLLSCLLACFLAWSEEDNGMVEWLGFYRETKGHVGGVMRRREGEGVIPWSSGEESSHGPQEGRALTQNNTRKCHGTCFIGFFSFVFLTTSRKNESNVQTWGPFTRS